MHKIVNNTVQVPLADLKNDNYKNIEVEKTGRKYAYLNLQQYEDFLSILQDTKFKRGDKVFWVRNKYYGHKLPNQITEETVNTDRIDVITKVNLSFNALSTTLGDSVRYSTSEVNGSKKGLAYEPYLVGVREFDKINGTNFSDNLK